MLDTQGCKYTYTGSALLIAFPLQQWLHERPSLLHYTYIACLVAFSFRVKQFPFIRYRFKYIV